MKKSTFFSALILAIAALSACTEKWDLTEVNTNVELDMGLALPLANITATVDSFLPRTGQDWILDADADGTVYFNIITKSREKYNENLDHDGDYTVGPLTATIPAGTSGLISIPMSQHLGSINNKTSLRVSWGRFKSVNFAISFSGINDADIDRVYLIAPYLSATADPDYTVQLSRQGNGQWATSDLTNQYFRMDRNREFPMTLCIQLKNTITAATAVSASSVCHVRGYDVLYGTILPDQKSTFVEEVVHIDDYLDPSILDSIVVPFKNPVVYLTVESNVGSPIQYQVKNVRALTKKGKTIHAEFPDGTANFNFVTTHYPDPTDPRQVGDTAYNTQVFDRDFGHTERLFTCEKGDHPKDFVYEYNISIPDTFLARQVDMFVPEYPFSSLRMDLRLPLDFNEGLFALYKDTFDVDIDTTGTSEWTDKIKDLDSLTIYLTGCNGLPLDVNASLFYLDGAGKPLQFNQSLREVRITGSATDEDGKVIKSKIEKFKPIAITIANNSNSSEFDMISRIKKIGLRLWLEKPVGKAHIMKDDALQVHLAAKGHGKYVVNLKEDKK